MAGYKPILLDMAMDSLYSALRSDEERSDSVYLTVLGGEEPGYIDDFLPPRNRVPTLRIMAMEWPETTKTG